MIQEVSSLGNVQDIISKKNIMNTPGSGDMLFTDSLAQAKELINATTEAEKKTTELTYDFMTGKNDNIHDLMIAQEKSSILLQFTVQVRNNVLEAYREIMRIPV